MAPAQSTLVQPQKSSGLDARWWTPGTGSNRNKWRCEVCRSKSYMTAFGARRHQLLDKHQKSVEYELARISRIASSSSAPPPVIGVDRSAVIGPLFQLLQDISADASDDAGDSNDMDMDTQEDETNTGSIDWDTVVAEMGGGFDPPAAKAAIADMTASLANWMLGGDGTDDSDPEPAERDDEDISRSNAYPYTDAPDPLASGIPRENTRAQGRAEDPEWYPWPDKPTCVLDILRHLPRSLFSDSQMETILWCLDIFGIDHRPSLAVLKTVDTMLQSYCGIESIRYEGPLGHIYYANDLGAILGQEMANPRVRPHMHFYPEECPDGSLKEGRQGHRWLHELSPGISTPMVRTAHQDFYAYEPAKLADGRVICPFRWFTRMSKRTGRQELFGEGWALHAVTLSDGVRAYVVHEFDGVVFSAAQLVQAFPRMVDTFPDDDLPDPRSIIGVIRAPSSGVQPWTHTDPQMGSPWRHRARGKRVMSLPLWLYCDDTSGNVSKKWNKHNSWLFTLAGLPRALAQQESNTHFLATSNIAPPLEMLHGIVSQLEDGQRNGFWAWDIEEQDMVLIIPAVLAILGDNPMQSELACHVGLAGRMFCRHCWVKGREAPEEDPGGDKPVESSDRRARRDSGVSDASGASSCEGSQNGADSAVGGQRRGRAKETMQELVDRARRFLGSNATRNRNETMEHLEEAFKAATTIGGGATAKRLKTDYGVKDTFQEVFMERIFAFTRKLRGKIPDKQHALDEFIAAALPEDTRSPMWRIREIDPNTDTPVEILHVILLGFIKYFWRDAMARVPKDKKELLKARLSGLDVSGLGIAPLAGDTLVTYAGSLTGRDFRTISQVAPLVLYDLVPENCLEAWLALSALVPLVWQPEIVNLDAHLVVLQAAIDRFLDCTARWTPRWFNKPKFHLIRHLVDHIRRFGPAILFATEGFESFNAIIRGKSVHSNHQAPSRDISRGFAHANRVRHLLSGGVFLPPLPAAAQNTGTGSVNHHTPAKNPYCDDRTRWRSAGPLPLALAGSRRPNVHNPFHTLLPDVTCLNSVPTGSCVLQNSEVLRWNGTSASARLQHSPYPGTARFWTCVSAVSTDGDTYRVGSWVVIRRAMPDGLPTDTMTVGKVAEILQVLGSRAAHDGRANSILVHCFNVTGVAATYKLPRLLPAEWALVSVNMRSSRYIQTFAIKAPSQNRDECIMVGARAEIDAQKSTAAAKLKTAGGPKGKAKTKGPGLPSVLIAQTGQSESRAS
ncbi:hypothetical protein VTO73DRAFT_13483 [Trametes versicolor]